MLTCEEAKRSGNECMSVGDYVEVRGDLLTIACTLAVLEWAEGVQGAVARAAAPGRGCQGKPAVCPGVRPRMCLSPHRHAHVPSACFGPAPTPTVAALDTSSAWSPLGARGSEEGRKSKGTGSDAALYSNRSFAFLKLNQPARALVDAEDALRRRPNWAKGYFRKAEALRAAGLHAEAVGLYARGSDLDPSDDHLREQCEASRLRATAQARVEWLWVAVGAALGLALLAVLAAAPDINSPGVNGPGMSSPGGARRRPAG
eukprot:scaffold16436_cov126-Isochrysis_galbana.AAC.3